MNELHPIQLLDILVEHLSITVSDPKTAHDFEGEVELELNVGTSEFSPEDPFLAVGVRARVVPKNTTDTLKSAFVVEVHLSGQFEVNFEKFKFEHLEEWSRINAPFLLLPYVREQIYGLAIRAGVRGLVIPLLVQPRKINRNLDSKQT